LDARYVEVIFPGGFEEFTRGMVLILQERGRFRREYRGSTLRAHPGPTIPSDV